MEGPPSPADIDLKKIINKLAEFVARNGPDFEMMTKKKQENNPKFSFLYGGDEFFNYYVHRVAAEQEMLKHHNSMGSSALPLNINTQMNQFVQQTTSNPINNNSNHNIYNNMGVPQQLAAGHMAIPTSTMMNSSNNHNSNVPNLWVHPVMQQQQQLQPQPQVQPSALTSSMGPSLASQIETLIVQQTGLREQIRQSENNLQAQHSALMQQQQQTIEEAVTQAQHDYLQTSAKEQAIDLLEFDGVLQPIIDSCTKDSISAGKSWILQHTSDPTKCNIILQYLLKKALTNGAVFSHKLHLIYLVNDVLHHCARKNVEDLKNGLESIVIPMFCSAQIMATPDQSQKLTKLLSLWESKANFFDACVISKLRSPQSSLQEYRNNLITTHSSVANAINKTTKATYDNYQQQHQAFVQHATQQLNSWETQKQMLEQQSLKAANAAAAVNLLPPAPPPPPQILMNNTVQMDQMSGPSLMSAMGQSSTLSSPMLSHQVDTLIGRPQAPPPPQFPAMMMHSHQQQQQQPQLPVVQQQQQQQAPIGQAMPASFLIPDLSKPPPGFNNPPTSDTAAQLDAAAEEEINATPSAPYFELPAGLMVPLIRLEDYKYKPLDASEIRLPPPAPPSERLLGAIDAFYSPPSHDRPRDGNGWEKLALYEYYKVKNQARSQKEEAIEQGTRQRSRSPTPIDMEVFQRIKKLNKRRYRSKSRSRSPPPVRPSALEPRRPSVAPTSSRSSSSAVRHPRLSPLRNASPPSSRRNSSPRSSNSSRDRSDRESSNNSSSSRYKERERSISPPSFLTYTKSINDSIDETNKGHQMLLKMGWGGQGTGLGASAQGIDRPIDGGEVRDRKDMYKGVGLNMNDPYENFRKNKGAAFITRMKARADDR